MKSASETNLLDTTVGHRAAFLAILLVIGVMLGLAYAHGSRRQIELQQSWAQIVGQENGALCRKFSMAPGAALHAECTSALNDLRRRHEQHLRMKAEGLL